MEPMSPVLSYLMENGGDEAVGRTLPEVDIPEEFELIRLKDYNDEIIDEIVRIGDLYTNLQHLDEAVAPVVQGNLFTLLNFCVNLN